MLQIWLVRAHAETSVTSAIPKGHRPNPFLPLKKRRGFCLERRGMKKRFLSHCLAVVVAISALVPLAGCDSGEKARDELTGNRAVKQYHQSTKDIGKIVDRQTEKHKSIPDDDKQDSKSE